MKSYITLICCTVLVFLLSLSCSSDKDYLSLPVFEIGLSNVSSDEDIHVGDNVILSLNNMNKPQNIRYDSYKWSCSPDVDGLQSATPNLNNSFKPRYKGKHDITITIEATNFVDGKLSDNGKTVTVGETTNSYKVSVLKTTITVKRTIFVK